MVYDITGKVKVIGETQVFGAKGFAKRELVLTVEDGKYPQDISIEFVQDKADLLDAVNEGQEVTVSFNIRGREYNGRYYNSLQGWKLQATGQASASAKNPVPQDDDDSSSIPF